jgi:hypothetical protein
MRIFSLHKSKSKKQVSEKTPKLAANKFLEKRKVGTVIYLHEHPSGKIHGPYRKEYDKKIMKGGLSIEDFRVDRPELLPRTVQLIIKRPRVGFLSNEPRLFFGNNKNIDSQGNSYYTFVCKNKDYDINNLILFRKLEFDSDRINYQIRSLRLEEVKGIPPQILLGFYTQYIERCKEDFPEGREIIFRILYMRRLFFYLFYHILPIITIYIVNTYFRNMNQNRIQRLRSNSEIGYFMDIVSFIRRISPVDRIIDEICFTCNIPTTDQRIIGIKEELRQSMEGLKGFNFLTQQERAQELSRSIRGLQEIVSNNSSAGLAHGIAMTGALPNPLEVVQTTGLILGGIFKFCEVIGAIMGAFR